MEVAQRYELLTLFALCTLLTLLRDAVRKKTGLCGENSQVAAPPPVWETPVIKKKLGLFSFYNLSNIFGLHQKIHNFK